MALIKCEECGHCISDKARFCPKCGAPVELKELCSECGNELPSETLFCPNCGCPTSIAEASLTNSCNQPSDVGHQYDIKVDEKPNVTKRILLWSVVGVMILCIALYLINHAGISSAKLYDSEASIEKDMVEEIEEKEFWEDSNFEQNSNVVEQELSSRAKNGDLAAIRDLGMCFLHPESANGSNLRRDSAMGIRLLEVAANQNEAEAQYMLSGEYFGMFGTEDNVNYEKGKYWLLKAANLGHTKAETAAGEFYYHGNNGFGQNYHESLKWYKRVATKGAETTHAAAQYNIGLFYLYGYGVEVDRKEAKRWFEKSATNGYGRAKQVLLYEFNEY